MSRAQIILTSFLLSIVALVLLATALSKPSTYQFDEEIYAVAARSALARGGNPQPEHPPLGKYLMAAGIAVAGDNPAGCRLANAICGAVTVVAVFLWTWVLLHDYSLALIAAGLTLFNNFLYVMSRTTMLDVPMFMFSMWGLVGFVAAIEMDVGPCARRAFLLLSGLMFGLAGASKWSAVGTFAAVLATSSALLWCRKLGPAIWNADATRHVRNMEQIGVPTLIFGLVLVPIISYLTTYVPVFRTTHTPFSLVHVMRMHAWMWTISKAVQGNPAIYSPWYSWPFKASPMRGLSYLMGNFVVMWGGLAAVGICVRRLCRRLLFPELIIFLLYAANLLQWSLTPRKVTYYYYYYSAAMFLGMAIAVALRGSPRLRIFGIRIGFIAVLTAFVFFLYCYPRMAHLEAPWDCMFGCWD